MLTATELQNLIVIVGTHPTPEGVSSQAGQVKASLIYKLQSELKEKELLPVEPKDGESK